MKKPALATLLVAFLLSFPAGTAVAGDPSALPRVSPRVLSPRELVALDAQRRAGTLLLLQDDDLRLRLAAEPALIEDAVEEMLRYVSPVQFSPRRVALEDVEVGGVIIPKGEGLFMLLASANRDEAMFDQPDRLDAARDASNHLAFGFGIHQCLGQMLARVELKIAFEAILRRLPNLKLAVPLVEIRFKHDMQIYGVHNLPVTW